MVPLPITTCNRCLPKRNSYSFIRTLQDISHRLAGLPATRRGKCFLLCLSVTGSVLVGAVAFFSLPFEVPSETLDPSWRWALHEAFCQDLRFGKDIVFSFGPYGFLYGRMYHPETFSLVVSLKSGLLLIMIWSLFEVIRERVQWFLVAPPFIFLVSLFSTNDDAVGALLQFCLCVALGRSKSRPFAVAAGMALALISLTKFMFLPASAFLLLVLLSCGNRTIGSWCAGSFLAAILVFWLAIGQNLGDVYYFILKSLEISFGYTEAMASEGPRPAFELLGYILGCATLFIALLLSGTKEKKQHKETITISLFAAVIVFVFLKHGFVRHDVHATFAYSTLSLLALGTAFIALVNKRRLVAALALLVCVTATTSYALGNDCARLQIGPKAQLLKIFRVVTGRTPLPWKGLETRFELAKKDIMTRNPLPSIEGTIDAISFNQGVLFAYGMRWTPRPVFQSYSCYTPRLITLNGNALDREGPDHLLVRIQPIDGRLSTQEDSLVWRVLLDWYEPVGTASGFALLKRRAMSSEWKEQEILAGRAETGQLVRLPETKPGSLLWLSIAIDQTLGDHLQSLLFKLPETTIVTIGSQGSKKNRYLVMAGQAGFIVSPRILSIEDLTALHAGQLPLSGDVRAFSLERGSGRVKRTFDYRVSLSRKPQ